MRRYSDREPAQRHAVASVLPGLVPPQRALEFLHARAAASAELHEHLRQVHKAVASERGPLADYGRLALEWGLRFSAMQREWAEWAACQLGATHVASSGDSGTAGAE
ncbi:hypothetical protein NGB36_02345 [Streptomyces sp. RB6PN25]|uniref:Transcription regulator PadR C-terminal domain-containing protein n=1 Tax=Streptomyces humicola TaxID=2953240 RepID=A0ABT1PP85_9ACTN|nr:hypothetical protein [Streptomyces humicola]MCQ4079469.1 hypothetical protein [Streptomyces humicola]